LKYSDGGKLISIPPAADVANAYVQKFLGGNPFAIVANQAGILSNPNLAGLEYMIDKVDRDSLEPFGYNSIIQRASSGQIMIYANTTAYQLVKSDFNNLHVRELLNTLEIQTEEVLEPYVFTFNNPVTRLNIINSLTPILETTKDAGALLDYSIVMDETNNTASIIADGLGIVDIGVTVTGALTKIINRVTVNTITGAISSGGFVF
jgi:phage tail sheath protein FI